MRIAEIPARVAAGAFILNSGIGKLKADDTTIEQLQQMGSAGVPQLKDLSTKQFKQFICATEIGVGAALLTPFVPGWLAGAALTAFGGGLVNMYLHTPGMTEEDGIRPTQAGIPLAKDSWLVGIGASLVLGALCRGKKGCRRKK